MPYARKEDKAKQMREYRKHLKDRSNLVKRWKKKYVANIKIRPPSDSTGDLVKDQRSVLEWYQSVSKLLIALRIFVEAEEKTGELTNLDELDRIFREGYDALQKFLAKDKEVDK